MNTQHNRRIFFALWPDDEVRKNIVRVFNQSPQAQLSGRHLVPTNLHLTLHFLGNISQQQFDCVQSVAEKLNARSFQLTLNNFGAFARARVFWSGPSIVPLALGQLQLELGEVLAHCDYRPEKRPFTPHVTLMRKVKCAEELIAHEPVIWRVNQFALIESVGVEGGVEYRPLKFYKLL